MASLLGVFLGFFLVGSPPCDAAPPAKQNRSSNNRMDDDLLRDVPATPSNSKAAKQEHDPLRSSGEDLGSSSVDKDWLELNKLMRETARQLKLGETADRTQRLQADILTRLNKIAAQSQSSKSVADGRSGTGSDAATQNSDSATGSKPAGDTVGTGQPRGTQTTLNGEEADAAGVKIWGQLPKKFRSQLQSAGSLQFLPGFERQIEEYYRKLAEQ